MATATLGKTTNMKEYEKIAARAKFLAQCCHTLENDDYMSSCLEEYETRIKNGEALTTYEISDYEELLVRKEVIKEAQTALMKLLSK